ncbi:duboraya [Aplochiton taeniatus]
MCTCKPGATSHPAKAKRNSALIEKLQANLAISPQSLLPSPKSPGLRLLPPFFTPPSPSTTPTSPLFKSEEETPATFETPATETKADGSLLPSINKSRARVSIRRRPPSRRYRKSSSGEEAGGATEEDTPLSTPDGPEPTAEGGEGGGGGEKEEEEEVFKERTGAEPEDGPKAETQTEAQESSETTVSCSTLPARDEEHKEALGGLLFPQQSFRPQAQRSGQVPGPSCCCRGRRWRNQAFDSSRFGSPGPNWFNRAAFGFQPLSAGIG